MPTSIVQSAFTGDTVVSPPYTQAFSGAVTPGHLLVAAVQQNAAGDITWSFADSVNGSWNTDHRIRKYDAAPNRTVALGWCLNTGAGTPTVTATPSAGTANGFLTIFEINLSGSVSFLPSSYADPSVSNTHYASEDGISYPADAFVVVCGMSGASWTATAAGTNYTKIGPTQERVLTQYRISTDGVSGDRGTWTNTGTARAAVSVMAAFYLEAAPVTPAFTYPRVAPGVRFNAGL
jgi:hypothetical protein